RRRYHETIRLHAAIDLRNITAHHGAGGAGPGSIAMRKLVGALEPHTQQFLRAEDLLGFEKLIAFESIADRLLEDLHIRQPRIALKRIDARLKTRKPTAKALLIGVGDLDAGARNEVERTRRLLGNQKRRAAERAKTQNPFHRDIPPLKSNRRCGARESRCRSACARRSLRPWRARNRYRLHP